MFRAQDCDSTRDRKTGVGRADASLESELRLLRYPRNDLWQKHCQPCDKLTVSTFRHRGSSLTCYTTTQRVSGKFLAAKYRKIKDCWNSLMLRWNLIVACTIKSS
jgi:hypothetical protein